MVTPEDILLDRLLILIAERFGNEPIVYARPLSASWGPLQFTGTGTIEGTIAPKPSTPPVDPPVPPVDPPPIDPPHVLQDLHLFVVTSDSVGIPGARVTSEGQDLHTTSGAGHTHFAVTKPANYHLEADGYISRDVMLDAGTHRIALDRESVPVPPPVSDLATLSGWLRSAPNASWGDDSGPRSVRFCSAFCLVRWMHDKPDFAKRQLDKMIGRYHGARIFWCLLHPGAWVPMNASVDPYASWFDAAFRQTLEELWQRGLRAQLTAGDLQFLPSGTDKTALYRRIAEQCKAVNQQVVALTEMVNEARVNSDEREDWAYWANLSREWQKIYPWGMHGLSDPGQFEEPAALKAASREPATCALSHGTRQSLTDSIRRAFNLRYEGYRDKPICEGEPNGIDTGARPGVTDGTKDRAHIFGLYAAKVLTGQFLTHFDSAGLGWHHYELDREWGFKELPALWSAMHIPEDVGTWRLVPGHKADAPITVRSFQDPGGSGPERCDNMVAPDGSKGYAILHGGSGQYEPRPRQSCDYVYWQFDGVFMSGSVSEGAPMMSIDSSRQAIVIQWWRR